MAIEVIHCKKTHFFYTIDEVKEKGIKYNDNWRKGEIGDWVLSDNDYVCQILRKYVWFQARRKHTVIGFANGQHNTSPSYRFIAQAKKKKGFKEGSKNLGARVTKDIGYFIDLLIKTGNVKFAFDIALANRKRKITLQSLLLNLLTKESFKRVFSEKLETALKESAITPEYLLKAGKDKLDDSKCKGKEWFQVWETMLKLSGMLGEDSKNRLPEPSDGSFFGKQIEGDNGEDKRLLPEKEVPVELVDMLEEKDE